MKNKTLIFETGIYFLGSILVSILGFIISILYAKMFSPADYGEYSLAYSTYGLIVSIYSGWIGASIIRNYMEYKKKEKQEQFYASFMQVIIFMTIIFIIISTGIIKILNINSATKNIFIILTIIFFFEQTLLVINTILRTNGNAKQYSINTVLNNILKIAFLLSLYYIFKIKSVNIIVISLLISEIVQFIYLCSKYSLWKYYNFKLFSFKIIKRMFLYGFPMIGVSLTTWVLSVSDRYIIKIFYSESQVGIYSYSYSLGNSLFNMLIQFIMLGAFPNIVKTWEERGREATQKMITKYMKLYFYIVIPACFGVLAIAKDMFITMTDVRYYDGYSVFIVTCIGIAILGVTQYTNKAWEVTKQPKMILKLNVFSALLNLILNFSLIPIWGYKVAAFTTLISHLVYLIITIILSTKILPLRVDIKSLLKVFISSMCIYISICLLRKYIILECNTILVLVLECIIGASIYIISMFIFKEFKFNDIKTIYYSINNKLNKGDKV